MTDDAPDRTTSRASAPFVLPEAPRPATLELEPHGRPSHGFWHRGFPALVVLVALVAAVVLRFGVDALLASTDGQSIDATAGADDPGFEAIAEPTPLLSVVTEDAAGELSSVAVLALSNPQSGTVLVVPPDTIVDDGVVAPTVLRSAYRGGGTEALGDALDRLLGFDVGELLVLDARGWAQATGPVAPIEVTFEQDVLAVVDGSTEVRWSAGPNELDATEIAEAMVLRTPDESDLVHMGRIEQLWRGWLAAVAAGGADAIAGERDVGLGRFVLGLAAGEAGLATPPMVVAGLPDGGGELYALEPEGAAPLLLAMVPFPTSAYPGQRLRVRVLDGTGQPEAALRAADALVGAGAEVAIIGNADRFDVATTRVVFHREEDRQRVEALRDALGGGDIVLVEEEDPAVDLSVILGASVGGSSDG